MCGTRDGSCGGGAWPSSSKRPAAQRRLPASAGGKDVMRRCHQDSALACTFLICSARKLVDERRTKPPATQKILSDRHHNRVVYCYRKPTFVSGRSGPNCNETVFHGNCVRKKGRLLISTCGNEKAAQRFSRSIARQSPRAEK